MTESPAGKVLLVTGGATGIGEAVVRHFTARGARVVVADQRRDQGEALVRDLRAAGAEARFVLCDVTRADDCVAAVEVARSSWGRLDLAFNNAGIVRHGALLHETSEADFDATLTVNLRGVFLAMKAEIAAMLETGGGAIVNTSSVGGLEGGVRLASYCASKHGVIGLTRSAALEYATLGIRVNAVCPGATDTDMLRGWFADPAVKAAILAQHPMNRVAEPAEIARAVAYLLSDDASFVTGQALAVDGGKMA